MPLSDFVWVMFNFLFWHELILASLHLNPVCACVYMLLLLLLLRCANHAHALLCVLHRTIPLTGISIRIDGATEDDDDDDAADFFLYVCFVFGVLFYVYIFIVHRRWSIQPLATHETHRQPSYVIVFSLWLLAALRQLRVYIYHGFDRAILVFICLLFRSSILYLCLCFQCCLLVCWLLCGFPYARCFLWPIRDLRQRGREGGKKTGNGIKLVDTSFACVSSFKHTYTHIFTYARTHKHTSQIRWIGAKKTAAKHIIREIKSVKQNKNLQSSNIT